MPRPSKQETLQRLAAIVAGKRRSLENAIQKLAAKNYNAGVGAAEHSALMLQQQAKDLVSAEIDRLGEQIRRLSESKS